MFRRLNSSLPKDPVFPADLEALGYFVNEKDQIRSIENPDQEFNYFISKNERVNDLQREAFNTCIRNEIRTRMESLGIDVTRLPLDASPEDPHVPIFTSANLATAKRTILYFGEELQDLGVFAYRTIGQVSTAAGTALGFVSAIQASKDSPGIIIANLGQLAWYRRGKRAVTRVSWNALPGKTAVSGPMRVDPVKNRARGNEDMAAHVKYVFEEVVRQMVNKDAKLDVIGVGEGASESVSYLDRNWDQWEDRIQAIAIGTGQVWPGDEIQNSKFKLFFAKRARAYLLSGHSRGDPLSGREDFGCNCYSAGEGVYSECIMPTAYKQMLGFFQLVNDVPGYEEMEFRRPELKGDAGWVEGAANGMNQDGDVNGEGDVIDVGIEVGPESQDGPILTEGNGTAGRPSGWVEEADEDEGEMEKIDP